MACLRVKLCVCSQASINEEAMSSCGGCQPRQIVHNQAHSKCRLHSIGYYAKTNPMLHRFKLVAITSPWSWMSSSIGCWEHTHNHQGRTDRQLTAPERAMPCGESGNAPSPPSTVGAIWARSATRRAPSLLRKCCSSSDDCASATLRRRALRKSPRLVAQVWPPGLVAVHAAAQPPPAGDGRRSAPWSIQQPARPHSLASIRTWRLGQLLWGRKE